MKKVWALSLVAVLCGVAAAVAGDDKMASKPMEGKIVKLDAAAKAMMVRDAAGKEAAIYWNDTTRVEGEMKEGQIVHYKATEKDGKLWASWIHVGELHKM